MKKRILQLLAAAAAVLFLFGCGSNHKDASVIDTDSSPYGLTSVDVSSAGGGGTTQFTYDEKGRPVALEVSFFSDFSEESLRYTLNPDLHIDPAPFEAMGLYWSAGGDMILPGAPVEMVLETSSVGDVSRARIGFKRQVAAFSYESGRLVRIEITEEYPEEEPVPVGAVAAGSELITFAYNEAGQLVSAVESSDENPTSQTRFALTYDAQGRIESVFEGDYQDDVLNWSRNTVYVYNEAGNLTSKTTTEDDRRNLTEWDCRDGLEYHYEDGVLTSVRHRHEHSDGSSWEDVSTISYDDQGRIVGLSEEDEYGVDVDWAATFDEQGRFAAVTVWDEPIRISYDEQGRVSTLDYDEESDDRWQQRFAYEGDTCTITSYRWDGAAYVLDEEEAPMVLTSVEGLSEKTVKLDISQKGIEVDMPYLPLLAYLGMEGEAVFLYVGWGGMPI